MSDKELADSLRGTLREVEDKSVDRWFPILGRLIYLAGIIVSALDFGILQHGREDIFVPERRASAFHLSLLHLVG